MKMKNVKLLYGVLLIFLLFIHAKSFAQTTPIILSFTPDGGRPGTTVTITGNNFNPITGSNVVYFGTAKSIITSASSTQLVVTVPLGAAYAPISVITGGLVAFSSTPFLPKFTANTPIAASTFPTPVDFTTGTPAGLTLADIDGDGKTEILTTNVVNNTLTVLPNKSVAGSFTSSSLGNKVDFYLGLGNAPKNVAVGDLDGDGKLDVVISNINKGGISILRNITTVSGVINSSSFAPIVNIPIGPATTDVEIADLDGDGKLDIAVLVSGTGVVSVLRNVSTSGSLTADSFSPKVDFTTGTGPEQLAISDLDGDGKPELAITNAIDDTFSILQNVSTTGITASSFVEKVDFFTGNSPEVITIADFDGDGKKDIALVNNLSDNTLSIYQNKISNGVINANSFGNKVDFQTGSSPYGVAVADLDGDSKLDIAVTNNGGSSISFFKNVSVSGSLNTNSFNAQINFNAGATPGQLAIGDIDGDGKPDLVFVGDGSRTTAAVIRNTLGDGIKIPPTVAATPSAQTICSGTATSIVLSNPNLIPGTTYSWTIAKTAGLSGASAGSGSTIAQVLTAASNSEKVTYTITPTADGVSGSPISVDVTVIKTVPDAPQVTSPINYCQNAVTKSLTASGSNLLWYTTATGSTGSASAIIPASSSAGTASYFVSQSLPGCGESARAQIDVVTQATATLSSSTAPVSVCSGSEFKYTPTSAATGASFSWKRANVVGITPALGGGDGAIQETLINGTSSPIVVSYAISIASNGCSSLPQIISVTVNPSPVGMPITTGVVSNKPFGAPFTLITTATSVAAASYSITISNGGLVASAGNPVNGTGKSASELIDDAWTNNSNSLTSVLYSVIPVSNLGCSGLPFLVTAKVQPDVIFNVEITNADRNSLPNTQASLNNGINTEAVVNSGSQNRVLLGATFQLANKVIGLNEPLLSEFTLSFNNSIAGVLTSPKIYQSLTTSFDIKKAVLVSTNLTLSDRSINVQLKTPRDLSLGAVTYFFVTDIDPFVTVNTLPLTPSLKVSSIVLSKGVISGADINGRGYSFTDNTPPLVLNLSPTNGKKDVIKTSSLTIQFNETVVSQDRTISLYTFDRKKVADLTLVNGSSSTGNTFTFSTTGVLSDLTNYYVVIPTGDVSRKVGFIDLAGNAFAGYSTISDWTFKTRNPLPPKFVKTSASDKNPNLKLAFIDSTLVGGNLQVALDKVGKAYYLITPSPSTKPTASQVFDPTNYTPTKLAASSFPIEQDSLLQFSQVSGSFTDNTSYDIWLVAESSTGVRMDDSAVEKITFTAGEKPVDPINPLPFDPFIISAPNTLLLCAGDYQNIPYPITISERNPTDFVVDVVVGTSTEDQSFNILMPTGFEFNTNAPKDTVIGKGSDIVIKSFTYVTNSVLKIVYSIKGITSRDKIVIDGLQVKVTGSANSTGKILRVGGNGLLKIPDFTSLGTLKTYKIDPVSFDIYNVATNKPVTVSIANNVPKVSLRPRVNLTDYGAAKFDGDGVVNDEFVPSTVELGSIPIKLTYTNEFGCSAEFSKTVNVYDFTKAVNGLDTLYNVNVVKTYPIKKDAKGFNYRLDSLKVSLPPGVVSSNFDVDIRNALTGPDKDGTFFFNPSVFNTAVNKAKFNAIGGRLGTLQLVARYSNLSSGVLETFIQSIGLWVAPQTSIEVTDYTNLKIRVDNKGVITTISSPSATNRSPEIYCEDLGLIRLAGFPQPGDNIAGFFTIDNAKPNGLIDPLDGNAIIDTKKLKDAKGYGSFKLRYIAQNTLTNGTDTTVHIIKISPKPLADFLVGTACAAPENVQFTDASALPPTGVGSVVKYAWDFGDDKASGDNPPVSSVKNPTHQFRDARTFSVALTVTSDLGCASDAKIKSVRVGANPVVGFSFTGVSTAKAISFTDVSTLANSATDPIVSRKWSFGDLVDTLTASTSLKHQFAKAGVFSTKLTITSSLGCVRSKTYKVAVLPKETVTTIYQQNFESNDGGWQTLRFPFNGSSVSSWKRIEKSDVKDIRTGVNEKGIWKTENKTGTYDPTEISYLYSPAFDFSSLSRPVISFNLFHQMEVKDVDGSVTTVNTELLDGVVLQYSLDDRNIADSLKDWRTGINGGTLGIQSKEFPSGYNWYTGAGLPSKPGDQLKSDYAWTNSKDSLGISKWREARHALDTIALTKRSQVVFRFALGSTSKLKAGVGFALDNVRIGSRSRTVLLENFRNLSSNTADEKAEIKILSDNTSLGKNVTTGVDVIKVNYHVGFPSADPFNLDNTSDPGARALFYNITKTPRVQMDGSVNGNGQLFSTWTNQYRLETLRLALADIKITADTTKGVITTSVVVTSTAPILPKETTVLMIGIVEQDVALTALSTSQQKLVATGETSFNYILKKLLPSAAGVQISNDLKAGIPQTFGPYTWAPDRIKLYASDLTKPNLAVVAFLQNSITKEVYQSAIAFDVNYPFKNKAKLELVTGLENMNSEEVSLYPSPADKQVTIELPNATASKVTIHLINQLGQVSVVDYIAEGQSRKTIPTQELTTGVYIVQLSNEEGRLIRKKVMVAH